VSGNFILEFPSINSQSRLFSRWRMRASPRGLWSRWQVWLPRMHQRDACWAGEVSLKGSPITRLRDRSPVSRYLYIDLWLYHSMWSLYLFSWTWGCLKWWCSVLYNMSWTVRICHLHFTSQYQPCARNSLMRLLCYWHAPLTSCPFTMTGILCLIQLARYLLAQFGVVLNILLHSAEILRYTNDCWKAQMSRSFWSINVFYEIVDKFVDLYWKLLF